MPQVPLSHSTMSSNDSAACEHAISVANPGISQYQLPIRRHSTSFAKTGVDHEETQEMNSEIMNDSASDSSQVIFTPEEGLSEEEEIEAATVEGVVVEKVSQPSTVEAQEFHEAVIRGDVTTVSQYKHIRILSISQSYTGYTPLVMAIVVNELDMAKLLLENGADVHQQANKVPPTVYAVTRTVQAPQFIQLLLDYGATLNTASGPQHYNALHWATVNGCIAAVDFLVSHGMDMEVTCSEGRTPLLLAAEHGHTMIVKLLLAKGADLNHRSQNGGTALAWAVCNNYVDTVEYLLMEGIDVNDRDNLGFSALFAASSLGHIETVNLLIKEGADIELTGFEPRAFTPVMAAAIAGHADVVQILNEHGADLTIRNGDGDTILEAAMAEGHAETTAILLELLGGDYYPQESVALDIAIATSHTAIKSIMVEAGLIYSQIYSTRHPSQHVHSIDRVLEQGGDLVKPRAMSNMMHVALYDGELDVVVRLLAIGYDPNEYLSSGQTPLHVAVSKTNIPLIEVLLKYQADPAIRASGAYGLAYTPLHQALIALDDDTQRDTTVIDRLLESRRCELMAGQDARSTAFDYVLSHYSRWDHGVAEIMTFRMLQSVEDIDDDQSDDGSTMMHAAVWHGRTDLIDILLSKGANIDATDSQGRTPFFIECQRSTRLLRFLVSKGANPHAKDAHSQSALHAASAHGNIVVINLLLNIGLPINLPNPSNYTPLTLAVLSNQEDAALHLLSRGATIPPHTTGRGRGRSILHLASSLAMETLTPHLLTNSNLPINAKDDLGWTPLALACKQGSTQLIKHFLDAGADMNTHNHTNDTPLHIALQSANLPVARMLVSLGADIAARGANGQTALHVAAKCGTVHIVQMLLDRGADACAVDDTGKTALCGASRPGIARVLIECGASVEQVDKRGWTSLDHAVERGSVGVCGVLVGAGGDLEARTRDEGRSVREMVEERVGGGRLGDVLAML